MQDFLYVLISLVISLLLGFLFNKFKILKVSYFTNLDEDEGEFIEKHILADLKPTYTKFLTIITPIAITWGIFGVLTTIFGVNFVEDKQLFGSIIYYWIIISAVVLGLIPVFIAINSIKLPESMESLKESKFIFLLLSITVIGIVSATIVLDLSVFGVIILTLLSLPALISAWFAGEFYAIFGLRQLFKIRGWDYIEGKAPESLFQKILTRILGLVGFIMALLTPILAINSLLAIFSSLEVQEQGGPLGSTAIQLPVLLQSILLFVLLLGPLLSIATQPAGFLELTMNSDIYSTLAKFDWEEFNRKSQKIKDVINVRPYPKRIMAGILAIFLSFIMYVAILAIGGVVSSTDFVIDTSVLQLGKALKFIEVPILLVVVVNILKDLSEEREIYDIAKLGLREKRDMVSWTFWVLQNVYDNKYDVIEENINNLLEDEVISKNHRLHFYKGLLYALQGENAQAEPHFKKSMELEPKYADAVMEVGVVAYFQGRWQEAKEYLIKATTLKKSKTVWYNLGRVFDVLEEPEQALDAYNKALRIDKTDAKIWANLAGPYRKLGDEKKSEKCTRKALSIDPTDHIAKINLYSILLKQGKSEEMIDVEKDLMKNHGELSIVLENIAYQKAQAEDYQGAFSLYKTILEKRMVNPFNIQGISLTFSKFELHKELIGILETHIEKFPDDMHGKLLMGQAYLNNGMFVEAEGYLKQYVEKEKSIPEAFTKLSASLANLQKLEEAFDVLMEALQYHPKDSDLNFNMGLTKSLLGKSDFDQNYSLSLNNSLNDHYLNMWIQSRNKIGTLTDEWIQELFDKLGGQYGKNKVSVSIANSLFYLKNEKASEFVQKALDNNPDKEELSEIGQLMMNYGYFEKAEPIYEQLVKSNSSVNAYNNLGVVYLRTNRVEKGLETMIQGHIKYPEDSFLLVNICKIYLSLKNYQDAIPFYEKLLKLQPTDLYYYEYATCHALIGDVERAKSQYDIAVKLAKEAGNQQLLDKIQEMLDHIGR